MIVTDQEPEERAPEDAGDQGRADTLWLAVQANLRAAARAGLPQWALHHHALGLSIPCMVSQLTKALNQPVLVVSLGYMPKP